MGFYRKEEKYIGKSKAKAHIVMRQRQRQCWVFPQHPISWCQSVLLRMGLHQHLFPDIHFELA